MGLLRTVIWSACCIGLGIFLGTYRFGGHTAVEHAERTMGGKVKADVEDAIAAAKIKLTVKDAPTEKHTSEDKDAVNKLIARRKP